MYSKGWAWYYIQGNLILGVNSGYCFIFGLLWHFITKCDRYYFKTRELSYYKLPKNVLQNAPGFFLQSATILAQSATVITNSFDFFTKCDRCYKIWRFNYKMHQYRLL